MKRRIEWWNLIRRRALFAREYRLCKVAQVGVGLFTKTTSGREAGLALLVGAIQFEIESDYYAVALNDLVMWPHLVANGVLLDDLLQLFDSLAFHRTPTAFSLAFVPGYRYDLRIVSPWDAFRRSHRSLYCVSSSRRLSWKLNCFRLP